MKVKRRSNYQNAYLDELGVDRALLEDKCLDFESLLEEFGWKDTALQPRQLSELENDLRREQGRLEAGSWLSADGNASREEKVSQVEALLDKTIQECDELEGLLTLYSVELGSLNEDINESAGSIDSVSESAVLSSSSSTSQDSNRVSQYNSKAMDNLSAPRIEYRDFAHGGVGTNTPNPAQMLEDLRDSMASMMGDRSDGKDRN